MLGLAAIVAVIVQLTGLAVLFLRRVRLALLLPFPNILSQSPSPGPK
jgi:hypothetical protein